jgi:hypothetical protein
MANEETIGKTDLSETLPDPVPVSLRKNRTGYLSTLRRMTTDKGDEMPPILI